MRNFQTGVTDTARNGSGKQVAFAVFALYKVGYTNWYDYFYRTTRYPDWLVSYCGDGGTPAL